MKFPAQKQLLQYIDEHTSSLLEGWLLFAAQIRTFSNEQQISKAILSQLQSRGLTTCQLHSELPLIYSELHTGAPYTLLLYTHYDSFSPDLGNLVMIAAYLTAFDVYQTLSGSLPVNIKWLLDGGKSGDHSYLDRIVAEHSTLFQADGCLWQGGEQARDGVPLIAIGTKGLLRVELEVTTAAPELHSMYGSIVPNALWRLLWALTSLKNANEEILIEGFYDTLIPAEENLIELLHALPNDAQSLAQDWGLEQLLFGLQGFQLHYARFFTPTCTINHVRSGKYPESPTENVHLVIPKQAIAQLDFHLVPDQNPQDIFAKLQYHLKRLGFDDIQAHLLYGYCPTQTAPTDPFVQIIRRAITNSSGQEPRIFPTTTNSVPCYPFRHTLNIPIVISPFNLPKPEKQREETHISSQDFITSIKQAVIIIGEMGRHP